MELTLKTDGFDKILSAVLLVLLVVAVAMLLADSPVPGGASNSKVLERTLKTQARLLFIQNTYQPVELLLKENRSQEALLKLEELAVRFPGEAHGLLLKASVLAKLGADAQAASSYAAAVRQNGEYVDQKNPLSRRDEISKLTENGLVKYVPLSKSQPGDVALKQVVRDLYYLKSRLAGGCE